VHPVVSPRTANYWRTQMRTRCPTAELKLIAEERQTLEWWTRRPKTAQAVARRAWVVLACANVTQSIIEEWWMDYNHTVHAAHLCVCPRASLSLNVRKNKPSEKPSARVTSCLERGPTSVQSLLPILNCDPQGKHSWKRC
jgi:hypothetical protein